MTLLKQKLFTILLILLIFSCGSEKKEEKTQANIKVITTENSQTKTCKVYVSGVFPKDDVFDVFFSEIATEPFSRKRLRSVKFKGDNKVQELIFDLGDYYPEKIRLDIGNNKNMEEIIIEEVLIQYDNKVFKIDKSNFWTYFEPNQFILAGSDNNILLKALVTQGKEVYDPFFISTPFLIKELVRL